MSGKRGRQASRTDSARERTAFFFGGGFVGKKSSYSSCCDHEIIIFKLLLSCSHRMQAVVLGVLSRWAFQLVVNIDSTDLFVC